MRSAYSRGASGGSVPQVAVAQAAVRVQADLDDARMQPQVQKMRQSHQHAGQHAPVDRGADSRVTPKVTRPVSGLDAVDAPQRAAGSAA